MTEDNTTPRRNWSEDETTIALALYVQIPFGKIHQNTPAIRALGVAIGRSPSSVCLKLSNLARFDSKLQHRGISGMSHGSRMDQLVWDRFIGNNTQETDLTNLFVAADNAAEHLNLKPKDYVVTPLSRTQRAELDNLKTISVTERKRLVKVRLHQNMFRDSVLSAYEGKCAITDLCEPRLIEAAHIKAWCDCNAPQERLSPANGIALSASLHLAYDNNLIGISPDLKCFVSPILLRKTPEGTLAGNLLRSINGKPLRNPKRFSPNRDYLSDRYSDFRKSSDFP